MRIIKPLAPWAPWIAFMLIANGGMGRLAAGLVVALIVGALLAGMRLYRGVLMWAGVLFFSVALIAVFGLHSTWFLRYLAVIANAMLAVGAWGSLLLGRPFTVPYARETTDPAMWNHPLFIRVNQVITTAWAAAFTFNTGVAWAQTRQLLPGWAANILQFGVLLGVTLFSSRYPRQAGDRVRSATPDSSARPPS